MTKSSPSWTSSKTRDYLEGEGYKIGKVIGVGTYCKVREVYHNEHKMAVKIISRTKASKDFVTRFLPREIDTVKELDHQNIIQAYRIIDFDDEVYIFMEIAEGGDLLNYIKEHERLSENRARRYFKQILSAVRYLHELKVAHRDIKCENVLVHGNGVIKLTDFGFCRKCVDPVSGKRVLSETYCGSAAYAAPEVLEGIPYNPMMSDMWSMGIILFVMITGRMPFDDTNVSKMVKHQKHRDIHYPTKLHGQISSDCKSLIRHLLEPDVVQRSTIEQVESHRWFRANGSSTKMNGYHNGSTSNTPTNFKSLDNSGECKMITRHD